MKEVAMNQLFRIILTYNPYIFYLSEPYTIVQPAAATGFAS